MKVEVLIIGGGATGAGTFRDLALRGTSVMLVERGDFCAGASGGNHGMLHSGARYVVQDPTSARECAGEGEILRRIAWHCIQDVGGLFVQGESDPPEYGERFPRACREAGVWTEAVERSELFRLEPSLQRSIQDGFMVRDAAIDPFQLVLANISSGRELGGMARNHLVVESMQVEEGRIIAVRCRDLRNGAALEIRPGMVVNAAGAHADDIARMAGCKVKLTRDVGAMLVLNGRLVSHLVNRLRPPADGDIVVPHHTTSILGTTSRIWEAKGSLRATGEEVRALLRTGEEILPGVAQARAIRAYAGVRPLVSADRSSRESGRGYLILDHRDEGVDNLVSVVGGKLTTYRLMAEKVADLVARRLAISSHSRTSKEELIPREEEGAERSGPLLRESQMRRYGRLVGHEPTAIACSCEQVQKGELERWSQSEDVWTVQDLMHRTRAGFGYCQGAGCALDMVDALCAQGRSPSHLLEEHWEERERGITPVMAGDQLRQEVFRSALFRGFYGLSGGKG